MFNTVSRSMTWGGRKLTLETGKVARQADGCIMASYGETVVMAAVTYAKSPNTELDFFPLTVHYQEKYYASGKIPGGFFKREARPSEMATLTARLIDRPVRPLFPNGFRNPVDVICTVLSHDKENDPDIVAMIASSAALMISGVPFQGPIAAARVGFADGKYILCPKIEEIEDLAGGSDHRLDLVVAGTRDAVMMVESEAVELTETEMLGAVEYGHKQMQTVIDMIEDLALEAGKPKFDHAVPDRSVVRQAVAKAAGDAMQKAYAIEDKTERNEAISQAKFRIRQGIDEDTDDSELGTVIKELESDILRNNILNHGRRVDGRGLEDVRPIACEVGILPRAHGSALFTRGETQALVVTTLGTGEDEQIVDSLTANTRQNFLLHYNFPPYSVGETGRLGPPGRREIGHGKLAWRALKAVMPDGDTFPYTIRIVSEITESNGSSSMATVCGSSLSMMSASVPLKAPVAGVAMGLILNDDGKYAVLTDILGTEDHLGDMDFKVAGTETGITSLQMDIKVAGITSEIMADALESARKGRLHILGEMARVLSTAGEMSVHAPRIVSMKIPVDKIREVIGSGGKVIREITETSGAKIDINDEGIIKFASPDGQALEAARRMVNDIVAEPEVGKIYRGKVVRIMDFGAFVNIVGKRDGLLHISRMANHRVGHPSDMLEEGQMVNVRLDRIDDRGKMQLTMKSIDQAESAAG
ncbi:MAG: polyribonucleotide nucleotidyltransferase [Rhodobacteraceae bacterium]|nr:polyribonucleotide nucleotidyltransferase [Paracoccaceae bacterium]